MVQVLNGYSNFLRILKNPAHSIADYYSFQIFMFLYEWQWFHYVTVLCYIKLFCYGPMSWYRLHFFLPRISKERGER